MQRNKINTLSKVFLNDDYVLVIGVFEVLKNTAIVNGRLLVDEYLPGWELKVVLNGETLEVITDDLTITELNDLYNQCRCNFEPLTPGIINAGVDISHYN